MVLGLKINPFMNKSILTLLIAFLSTLNATNLNDFINKNSCDQIIDKQVFTICYDYNAKGAKYVAYTLDGKLVKFKVTAHAMEVRVVTKEEEAELAILEKYLQYPSNHLP